MVRFRARVALGLAIVVVMSVGVAACGGTGDSGGDSGGPATNAVPEASNQKYVMVTFLSGIEFWKPAQRGMEDAAKQLGVKVSYQGTPEYSAQDEIAVLDQVAAGKPAGILVTAQNADALRDPIKRLQDEGIEVVMFDSDSPESGRQTIVEVDNRLAGATAADIMAKGTGGKGKVGVITTVGQFNLEQRVAGFKARLAEKYPGMQVVKVADALGDLSKSATAASSFIRAVPDLAGIYSSGSGADAASAQALKEANKLDQVTIVGTDTDAVSIKAIEKGEVAGSILQDAYCMGYWGLQQIFAARNGLPKPVADPKAVGYPLLPIKTSCGVVAVTKDNVAAFKAN